MDNVSMTVLRYFITTGLSKNEWKVLGVMLEKSNDQRITLEEFEEETGIQPPNIIKALDGLRRKDAIAFTGKHSKNGRQYSVMYKTNEGGGLQPVPQEVVKDISVMVPEETLEKDLRRANLVNEAFRESVPKPLPDEIKIDGEKMWRRVREIMKRRKEGGACSQEQ